MFYCNEFARSVGQSSILLFAHQEQAGGSKSRPYKQLGSILQGRILFCRFSNDYSVIEMQLRKPSAFCYTL